LRRLVAGLAIGALALNAAFLARVAYAYGIAWPGTLENVSRAARIVPFTADSYAPDLSLQAGHLLDSQGRIADGLRFYRASLAHDSYNNPIWLLTALAEERLGNSAAAENAYWEAYRSEPNRAETRWMYANFLLRQRRRADALAAFRQVLERGWRYDEAVFETVTHFAGSVEIEQAVVPFQSEAEVSYFRFAVRGGDAEASSRAWIRLAGRYQLLGPSDITAFCELLAGVSRYDEARAAWEVWVAARGQRPYGPLYNGGFESEPLGGPYDWRFHPGQGMEGFRDASVSFTPPASAHLVFRNTAGSEHAALEQWLHLETGREYRLSFAWRSRNLNAQRPPAIELWQPGKRPQLIGRTESTPGTSRWHQEILRFTAPPTPLVRLVVSCGVVAGGDFWVDDFRLQRE
jgi:tetratricopeptide (TPR) repeat protein